MIFILNKWFLLFNKWFWCSANEYSANFECYDIIKMIFSEFYILQEIYIFSNLKFVFSNMRFTFSNLRFVFNEIKFIQLKSFIFSSPNLDVIKYTSKSIRQNERSSLNVAHPACKYYLALFELSLHITEMMFKGKVLSFFSLSHCSMN